jgi:antitoxin FitA
MTTISIPLSDEQLVQLKALAEKAGVTPEDLARARLEEWLQGPHEDFLGAAQYVLQKNAELYRRLA